MTVLALIALSIFIMTGATMRLVRANRIYAKAERELKVMAERPRELATQRGKLQKKLAETEHGIADILRRTETLKLDRTQLTGQLEVLQARKKDNVFALERIMQPGLEIWEVEISNQTYFEHLAADEFKLSWTLGRRFLVTAPNEQEARRRAELKYMGRQGYRIGTVERSSRF